jgi:DNA-binding NarL/FixJ family response regulator
MMIKILIADDHLIVREGLKQLFAVTDHVKVAGEAASGEQVMAALQENAFDLILLDMSMPGVSGVDLIARIRACDAALPILVLSMINTPLVVRLALQAGASGYLAKDTSAETLMTAIDRMVAGGRFIDPALAEHIAFDRAESEHDQAHQILSERERQILGLLVRGVSLNDIAGDLAISNKTVSTYKMRIMQKMDFRSNAELICYGMSHGLLKQSPFQ